MTDVNEHDVSFGCPFHTYVPSSARSACLTRTHTYHTARIHPYHSRYSVVA